MRTPFSSSRRRQRSLALLLTAAATVLGASCAADSDETLAPPAGGETQAAPLPAGDAAAGALERAFPAIAPRVLGRDAASAFVAADRGFARSVAPSRLASLDVKLPADAGDPTRITAPGGFEIRVREIDAEGEGALAERAVRYRRAGGSAFWTVSDGGAEEWLHLAAGTVRSKDEVAAAWEIEGASLVATNGAVALMDAEGRARAWVTAPEAWSADGRPIALRLGARGQRLELFADAQGEELLIDPGWVAVAPCGTGRLGSTVNTLAGGKVLLAGGVTGATIASNAELYDPATNTWSAAGNMAAGRYLGASALLANGRVLVLGGQTLAGYPATTEQYNPTTNTWSAAASMSGPRGNAAAIVLASGKVLAAGGYSGVSFLTSAEIYDPVTNTWSAAAPMNTTRALGSMVRLANGKVLMIGGENGSINAPTSLASAELYDPVTNTWSAAGNMAAGRYVFAAALLADGRVLVAGGIGAGGSILTGAELYDPVTNAWSAAPSMAASRGAQASALLGNGRLLVAGGASGSLAAPIALASAETYDPLTATWTGAGSMSVARYLSSTATLSNGDALVVGGTSNGSAAVNTVDRYDFTSLAPGAACGVGAQCASGFCVDGVCCQVAACSGDQCHNVGTCQAGSGVCSTPNKANGTACNDGNPCTAVDACQAGVCTGASPVVCNAQDQCHTVGVCDPATGMCGNPVKPDGAACNDGNPCTTMDSCVAGACTGASPVVCAPQDQCHQAGVCNPASGMCSNPSAPDGTACNDGNACLTMDTCVAGVCTGAMPVVCAPQDQCHVAGSCDPATGACSSPAKPDGTPCNDGNACTTMDTCMAGVCTGGTFTLCGPLDQCHDGGACDPATGACSNPSKADGTSCDDGDACTQSDSCTAGACTSDKPVICAAKDECHEVGVCAPATGTCDDPVKADGTPCTNGTCQGGTCKDVSTGSGGSGGGSTTGSGGATGTGGSATGTGGSATGTGGSATGTGGSATGTGGGTTSSTTGTGGSTGSGGGCSCRVAGGDDDDSAPPAALALLSLAALTWSRRRRA